MLQCMLDEALSAQVDIRHAHLQVYIGVRSTCILLFQSSGAEAGRKDAGMVHILVRTATFSALACTAVASEPF